MTAPCGAVMPEDPSRTCRLPAAMRHADHQDHGGAWAHPEVQDDMRIRREQKIRTKGAKRSSAVTRVAAAIAAANKAAGMDTAQTSDASEEFRSAFARTMIEVACTQEHLTTNDVWERWYAMGREKPLSAQAAGITGRMLATLGVLERTGDVDENTSTHGHSEDTAVRVWRSLVVGQDPEQVARTVAEQSSSD